MMIDLSKLKKLT